jgi:hypothetical protein
MAAYNQFGGEELRTHSFRNYGRAIRSLQESIQTDSQAIDDKVIATILLLCTFKARAILIRPLVGLVADWK